jgi:hypothetical protein
VVGEHKEVLCVAASGGCEAADLGAHDADSHLSLTTCRLPNGFRSGDTPPGGIA